MLLTMIAKVLYSQLFVTPPPPHFDCSGMTFIITGGNGGLGKEAARRFVRSGATKVIIACRSVDKGETAKEDIESSTQRSGVVEVWPLDLQNYDSIKSFAARVGELNRVDVLLENAGINTQKFSLAEGSESCITVNVISVFLLALLVLPHLQAMSQRHNITPTITIVSSEVHGFTSFPERKAPHILEGLNDEKTARMVDRYNVSKLLGVLACREIVQNHPVKQLKVTLDLVNPGLCQSGLMREMDSAFVRAFQRIVGRTAEVGSRTLVHASMQGPQWHGQYFSDGHPAKFEGIVRSKECAPIQTKVWTELAAKLEEIEPGCTKGLEA